jgi:hypothetical protein
MRLAPRGEIYRPPWNRRLWRGALLAALAVLCLAQDPPALPRTLATFKMAELFGVSWPEQPIEFRYDGGRPAAESTRMLGPDGRETSWQWVSSCADPTALKGCILVRGDLPAHAASTWTLQTGIAPQPSIRTPVRISESGGIYEITNGLTGIRIVTQAGNPAPWNRAPIQGILLPGGIWTGVGATPNMLYSESQDYSGNLGVALRTPMYTATGYNVSVVDSGPLKVVLKASYTFRRPRYAYGTTVVNSSGPGHYTLTVTIYAGTRSALIDEDSDMQFSYYLPLYAQLQPDQAQFRGHDSVAGDGLQNPACGYDPPGSVRDASVSSPIVIAAAIPAGLSNGQRVLVAGVQGNSAANGLWFAKTSGLPQGEFALYFDPEMTKPSAGSGKYTGSGIVKPAFRGVINGHRNDAYLDLTFSSDRPASYRCSPGSYRKLMSHYAPAAQSAPYYLMLYRSTAGKSGPVVGIYTGRPSQLLYSALGPSMPGLYTSDKHWISGTQDAGIQVDTLLRAANASTSRIVHRNWAIWTSTQADLLRVDAHQPISAEQSALANINLSHLYTYQLVYPDPPGGWKWMYLTPHGAAELIAAVRNGTAVCGSVDCYASILYNSEGSQWGRTLLGMWKAGNSSGVQTALDTATGLAKFLCETLANGDNRFSTFIGYYELGLRSSPETAVLNAILMDRNTTPEQSKLAKAALALFGSVFWDNDWFPIDNDTGEGSGLTNQYQQYLQYRAQAVAAAPSHPYLAAKLPMALDYVTNDFRESFSPTGAAAASTHYQSAFFEPLILNYESLGGRGSVSMADPKWAAYANWELSIQTPPEPRFGNLRKGYSNGDGNTEADVRTAMLATALYPVNPALASNLMWAWQQSNGARQVTSDAQFVTTIATIDPTVPAVPPHLSSTNIPGYHSVERYNFGTPFETVLWFINGGYYSLGGHRHADDGQVTIYAHSAPLAIDWNANLYSPGTPGRYMHDSVVFDDELQHPWSSDNPGLDEARALLRNPTGTEFAAFGNSTTSTAVFTAGDGTLWTRVVRLMDFNRSYPVIYVADSFSGPGAEKGKTLTWNLMANGPVDTPAGSITPVPRFSKSCQSPAGALPSNGALNRLAAGLNRFNFTGAAWPRHATRGIDWDLYTFSEASTQQFLIGNWGHGCQSSREAAEFQSSNGSPFAEIQDILRVHDTGPFTTLILPYRKTETPVRTVTRQACGIQIVQGGETSCFNDSGSTWTNGSADILTAWDDSTRSAFGITASGGPQEIVVKPDQIVWTLGGIRSGARVLTLPQGWTPDRAVTRNGSAWSQVYAGGAQATPLTIVFTPTAPR